MQKPLISSALVGVLIVCPFNPLGDAIYIGLMMMIVALALVLVHIVRNCGPKLAKVLYLAWECDNLWIALLGLLLLTVVLGIAKLLAPDAIRHAREYLRLIAGGE